jgi:hypothetical protein
MATQEEIDRRNERLDQLQQALDEWHEAEQSRYEDEAAFLRSFLRGRTGSERLSRSNTAEAEGLVVNDIASFLSGS